VKERCFLLCCRLVFRSPLVRFTLEMYRAGTLPLGDVSIDSKAVALFALFPFISASAFPPILADSLRELSRDRTDLITGTGKQV
jgi:hypothetical protein